MFITENKNAKRATVQLLQLHIIITFFHHWCIKINAFKSKGIVFSRWNTTYLPSLLIDNQTLDWSYSVKCLCVTIGHKLNFTQHINNITKNTTRNRGILYSILNRTSLIPIKNRLDLLKHYIFLIFTNVGV